MTTMTNSVDVAVPVRTAYDQWTQFEQFPNFMDGVDEIVQLDDTHTHWTTSIGGVTREFDAVITDQQPDRRVAWEGAGEVRHAGVVTFEPLGLDSTRVTANIDWEPEGIVEKAGSALNLDDHRVKQDLENFKKYIEERGRETGTWGGQV